jgi:hypothetical protein
MSTGAARTCHIGGALGVWPPRRGTEEPLRRAEVALVGGCSLAPSVVNGDGEAPTKWPELSGSVRSQSGPSAATAGSVHHSGHLAAVGATPKTN